MKHFLSRIEAFLFPAVSDLWITFLRIGLATETILYCWSFRSDWNVLFAAGDEALISRDISEAILDAQSPFIPRLGWLIQIAGKLGVSEDLALSGVWILLFACSCLLLLGLFSRFAAIATWFLYLSAAKSGSLTTYGVDSFTTIGLFYLMLSPLPDRCAIDYRIWNQKQKDRHLLGFFQRVLQLHLCVIYFSSGVAKSLGSGWWNGISMWRALSSPPFDRIPSDILVRLGWALPALGVIVCFLELGYPIFIWSRRTRTTWVAGIMAMHVAIGLAMGLYLFALIMIVLNLAAFGQETIPWCKRRSTTIDDLAPASLRA